MGIYHAFIKKRTKQQNNQNPVGRAIRDISCARVCKNKRAHSLRTHRISHNHARASLTHLHLRSMPGGRPFVRHVSWFLLGRRLALRWRAGLEAALLPKLRAPHHLDPLREVRHLARAQLGRVGPRLREGRGGGHGGAVSRANEAGRPDGSERAAPGSPNPSDF